MTDADFSKECAGIEDKVGMIEWEEDGRSRRLSFSKSWGSWRVQIKGVERWHRLYACGDHEAAALHEQHLAKWLAGKGVHANYSGRHGGFYVRGFPSYLRLMKDGTFQRGEDGIGNMAFFDDRRSALLAAVKAVIKEEGNV